MSIGSDKSYGYQGGLGEVKGEVIDIRDPEGAGRILVRMEGYEKDKGGIPDDKLVWYPCRVNGPQNAGVGVSPYYMVGSIVSLSNMGNDQWEVTGAAGGKGSKKNTNKEADVPGSTRPASPKPLDRKLAEEAIKKFHSNPFTKLQELIKFDSKSIEDFAANKAGGVAAKFKDLANIGPAIFNNAGNATNFIKGIDPGNLSGAIKEGLNMITNLNNSFPDIMSKMVGMGPLANALTQLQDVFGMSGILGEAMEKFSAITGAINQITNIAQIANISNISSFQGTIESVSQLVTDPTLNIPADLQAEIQTAVNSFSEEIINNNLTGAVEKLQSMMPTLQKTFEQVAPMADALSQIEIPKLSPADLLKDFAGQLTPINIPELPKVSGGPNGGFPEIPTFEQAKQMLAAAKMETITNALKSVQSAVKK